VKKLTIWQKLRRLHIARDRLRRRRKAAERKRRLLYDLPATDAYTEESKGPLHRISIYRRGKVRHGLARASVPMPANFCLMENYDAVASFLEELRHSLTITGQKLNALRLEGGMRRRMSWNRTIVESYIDFATLKRISPVSALVLASEYDRAINVFSINDWLRAINVDSWDPEVFQTLNDVGFLSLLGVEKAADLAVRNGIVTVPFLSGTKVNGASIDKLIRAMASLADSSGVHDSDTLLQRSRVYDGLGEAIQNVEDHAYPTGAFGDYPVVKKWWMTGAVEPSKKRFTIAIYDQGISIPVSLPRWTRFAEFRSEFARVVGSEYDPVAPEYDGETIAQAVQLGRSSTGESWHGKGLPVIRKIVDNCPGGRVRILSRNGEYSYSTGQKPTYMSHSSPIAGTLVEWELLL
jgi:hypothetical protein